MNAVDTENKISLLIVGFRYKDPSLEHDLNSRKKPWALSPLISTMPHLSHSRLHCFTPSCSSQHTGAINDLGMSGERRSCMFSESDNFQVPPFPPRNSIKDDWSQMHLICSDDSALFDLDSDLSSSSSSSSSLSQYSIGKDRVKNKFNATLNNASIHQKVYSGNSSSQTDGSAHSTRNLKSTGKRRKHFRDPEHRKSIMFGPHVGSIVIYK